MSERKETSEIADTIAMDADFKGFDYVKAEIKEALDSERAQILDLERRAERMKTALEKIRDYVSHPSQCEDIHNICNEALIQEEKRNNEG